MSALLRERLRQRADYTHKYNLKTGRHGWLRLTPAYSVKMVEELIEAHPGARRILDPFCGTATAALSAAYHGHEGVTTDINAFLVWLGRAKVSHYSRTSIANTRDACSEVVGMVRKRMVPPAPCPPIHNIGRWWSPSALDHLRATKAAIDVATHPASDERTLLRVAFCRSLIALSNAAFNHQSMSFKDAGQIELGLDQDMTAMFTEDVRFVLNGAAENPDGTGQVLLADACRLSGSISGRFDLLVTSPPYANRMSHIRELRPYMYWLDYLVNGRDAGELDWAAIGGTWGIATSRLMSWERGEERLCNAGLNHVLDRIAHNDNKSGRILANYVAKYFDDMWRHLQGVVPALEPGAEVHYIVGNSTFYGALLSVERIYAEMLADLGFTGVECRPIRKRNSKKELIEFDVTGRRPG